MNDVTKVIKSGWLRKQSGLVRSWQDRWFVLKGQSLYYYARENEAKQHGVVLLSGCTVEEIAFNRDEPDRWLVEISPAGSAKSSETVQLCANTEALRTEWASALRRAIYGLIGGGVFGGPLLDVMRYDMAHYHCSVPHIIKQCVELILEHGKEVEGIFRLSGRLALLKEMRRQYDEGVRPTLAIQTIDVHTTASLLKLYFRELPEPVIPFEHFESFLSLATSFKHNSKLESTLESLRTLTKMIPIENYLLLDYLTSFLYKISKYQNVNKMTEKNIATIFGTNILREEDSTPEVQMATQNLTTHVVLALVKWHDVIFSNTMSIKEALAAEEAETADTAQVPAGDVGETTETADLLGVDFASESKSSEEAVTKSPPPVPSRSFENGSKDSGLDLYSCPGIESTLTANDVKRRTGSEKVKARPAALVDLSPDGRKSATMPFTKVAREPSNFTSFIDSPLDSRYSLNIGDLPNSVEDLQTLVFSLKLKLKDQNQTIARLEEDNKSLEVRLREKSLELNEATEAKDVAVSKVVTLSQQLASYQSQLE